MIPYIFECHLPGIFRDCLIYVGVGETFLIQMHPKLNEYSSIPFMNL